jgi:DNA-binding HxlR family transcriptional regulator
MSRKKDVIEILPHGLEEEKERYLDVDEDFGEFWSDWQEEETRQVIITKALAKEIVRRITAMKIVKLLFKNKEPLRQKEILTQLNISAKLGIHNLRRLIKCGIVENVSVNPIDLHSRYYQLTDYGLGEKLVKRFHYLISFKLSDFISYSQTVYLSDLQKNEDFLRLCKKYDLTFEEAVVCLKINHKKLETVLSYDKKIIGFKRK